MTHTRTTTLAEIARTARVTFNDHSGPEVDRESGMAVVPNRWEQVKIVHDPSLDRMVIYGEATDGEWYVDWGSGTYEPIAPPPQKEAK